MLKVRSDLHLARRFYHISGVVIMAIIYKNMAYENMMVVLVSFTILCVSLDVLRLKIKPLNQKLVGIFGGLLRRTEISRLTGMSFLCLGVLAIVVVFPKEIVLLSLIMLAVGDPTSSIFGILYGKDVLIGKKTLQGSLACFVACTIIAAFYYYSKGIMTERIILASLITGFIGAFSELLPVGSLDDNFTFPIASSCLLWTLFQFMNGL